VKGIALSKFISLSFEFPPDLAEGQKINTKLALDKTKVSSYLAMKIVDYKYLI
jgi:hypothetical protein